MRFEHTAVVDGTPEEIFELTQHYARRLTWDPFLREAVLLDGATAPDVGVRAWCVARSGIGMETEYVSFEPPRVAAVKMTRGPRVLGTFAGTWELEPAAGGRTSVTFRYSFRTHPRWLAWLLEPLGRCWFSRETRLRVEALGRAVRKETGTRRATTAPGWLLAILGASVLLSGCGTLATAFDPQSKSVVAELKDP